MRQSDKSAVLDPGLFIVKGMVNVPTNQNGVTSEHNEFYCSAKPIRRQEYVAGLMFDKAFLNVALIAKRKPEWQRGKINAIGGKIEPYESPSDAMCREFWEETGVNHSDWNQFATITTPRSRVYFFSAASEKVANVISATDEEVSVYSTLFPPKNLIPNVFWLLQMARYKNNKVAPYEIYESVEEVT